MRRQYTGFTLIEFLIALVIIGFIVAILVNFFVNPIREAASGSAGATVLNHLQEFETARAMCAMKNITIADADLTPLVASGCLRSVPVVPPQATVGGAGGAYAVAGGKNGGSDYLFIQATNLTQEACLKLDNLLGLAAIPAGLLNGGALTDPPVGQPVCYNKAGVYTASLALGPGSLAGPPVSVCNSGGTQVTGLSCGLWNTALDRNDNRDYQHTNFSTDFGNPTASPAYGCGDCHIF